MSRTKVFEHRSVIATTLPAMIAFHEDPRAFRRLTPPPILVQMHRFGLASLTSGEVEFTLWFGPIPARWHARHEPGSTPHSFIDRTISGPVQSWVHEHRFTEVPGGVELRDYITYQLKDRGFWALFTRLFFDGLPLRFLFIYRHLRTRWGVKAYETVGGQQAKMEQ